MDIRTFTYTHTEGNLYKSSRASLSLFSSLPVLIDVHTEMKQYKQPDSLTHPFGKPEILSLFSLQTKNKIQTTKEREGKNRKAVLCCLIVDCFCLNTRFTLHPFLSGSSQPSLRLSLSLSLFPDKENQKCIIKEEEDKRKKGVQGSFSRAKKNRKKEKKK